LSSDIINRVRKVDVEKLDEAQLENITTQMSQEINRIIDDACARANSLLNIYGLETKMQIVIQKKD
jgi:hypothetical protein